MEDGNDCDAKAIEIEEDFTKMKMLWRRFTRLNSGIKIQENCEERFSERNREENVMKMNPKFGEDEA